jgi:ABC-type multidrug transport system ATPase subunit
MHVIARDIVTGYRARRTERIVTRASFQIEAGKIVALIGPNGSGKTTLLRTVLGLQPLLSGTLSIDGQSQPNYRAQFGIGYLPEGLIFPEAWSARGLFALAIRAGGRRAAAGLPRALELAGVDFDTRQPFGKMSKGMRQRVALALALLPLPDLLLLDEPEAGLDPAQRILLRDRLRTFAGEGRIVLVTTHDVTGICTIANQTYFLRNQDLLPVDPADLSDPARLVALFTERRVL